MPSITVRIRRRRDAEWAILKRDTVQEALSTAAEYARQGTDAEIWVDGRRAWPRMEPQIAEPPKARKAEAGNALLGILIALLLAMALIQIAVSRQPLGTGFADWPAVEEKR